MMHASLFIMSLNEKRGKLFQPKFLTKKAQNENIFYTFQGNNSCIYFVRFKSSMPVQIAFSKRAIELAL